MYLNAVIAVFVSVFNIFDGLCRLYRLAKTTFSFSIYSKTIFLKKVTNEQPDKKTKQNRNKRTKTKQNRKQLNKKQNKIN